MYFPGTSRARNALSIGDLARPEPRHLGVTVQQRCASAANILHKTNSPTAERNAKGKSGRIKQSLGPIKKSQFHRPIIEGLDGSCLKEVVGPGCDAAAQVGEG